MNAQHKKAMTDYLDAFNKGDLATLLALFAADAKIYSPTQDDAKTPGEFYPGLLARSKGTVFTLKSCFAGEKPDEAAVLFDYAKQMPDGSIKHFDCVDIFTFDQNGKIAQMRIIFDTKKLGI